MNLFYLPSLTETTVNGAFDKVESSHLIKVLRKKEGDRIHITNGKGILFEAVLINSNPKSCVFQITNCSVQAKPSYYLHLAVAPTKNNDRFEWFLEKATEIGISEITPIFCANSERKTIKLERFHRILESAMKQSLTYYKPILNVPSTFSDFINNKELNTKHTFIAHCEEGKKKRY